MNDPLKKWLGPVTGGDAAKGLLRTRLAMIALRDMIHHMKTGNEVGYAKAVEEYHNWDSELRDVIDSIGGLSDVRESDGKA